MSKFTQQIQDNKPVPLITVKEMTFTDQITDVGWLRGELKERMKAVFFEKHGQYFDCGVRVTL